MTKYNHEVELVPELIGQVDEGERECRTFPRGILSDRRVLIITAAVCLSTTTMALLEPCLPIWLVDTIKPPVRFVHLYFLCLALWHTNSQ